MKHSGSLDVAAAALAVVQIRKVGIDKFVKSALSFASNNERQLYEGVVERGIFEIEELLKEKQVL